MSEEVIRVENVTKVYGMDGVEVKAVRSLNLAMEKVNSRRLPALQDQGRLLS